MMRPQVAGAPGRATQPLACIAYRVQEVHYHTKSTVLWKNQDMFAKWSGARFFFQQLCDFRTTLGRRKNWIIFFAELLHILAFFSFFLLQILERTCGHFGYML